MAEDARSKSLLSTLGAELVSILTPVSVCMLIVVILVRITSSNNSLQQAPSIATLVYNEQPDDSEGNKLVGALLNSLVFVGFVTIATFVLLAFFKYGCTKCLYYQMAISTFTVFVFLGGQVAVIVIQTLSIPIDVITFGILLFNFAVVGVMAASSLSPMPIIFTQAYLVMVGVLIAFTFTSLPEWSTWVLLLAMAVYDVAAVLLPGGPLNLLVELSIQRNEQLPALIYEARPSEEAAAAAAREHARVDRTRRVTGRGSGTQYHSLDNHEVMNSPVPEMPENKPEDEPESESESGYHERRDMIMEDESIPLVSRHIQARIETLSSLMASERTETGDELEMTMADGSGSTDGVPVEQGGGSSEVRSMLGGGLKLGLGDFVFYSVLVGRAALFDLMTVYACYLAIVAGLGVTLLLLAVWRRALPALPISISLGVLFYLLTRLLMEPFVVQLTTNLVFF